MRKKLQLYAISLLLIALIIFSGGWLISQAYLHEVDFYPTLNASDDGHLQVDTGTSYISPGNYEAKIYFSSPPDSNISTATAEIYTIDQHNTVVLKQLDLSSADHVTGDMINRTLTTFFDGGSPNGIGFHVTCPANLSNVQVQEISYRPVISPFNISEVFNDNDLLFLLLVLLTLVGYYLVTIGYRRKWFSSFLPAVQNLAGWKLIFAITFVIYVAFILFYLVVGWFVSPSTGYLPIVSGDEPHYLIIAQSLLQDHDIFLQNQYANDSYASFFHYNLSTSLDQQTIKDRFGNTVSIHGFGLPALIAIPFAIGGVTGTKLFLAAVASGTASLIFLILERLGVPRQTNLLTVLTVALSVPFFFYSSSIFTEMIALFILAINTWFLVDALKSEGRSGIKPWIACIGLAFLPWLGVKYGLFSVAFLFIFAYYAIKKRLPARSLYVIAIAVILSIILFEGMLFYEFRSLNPIKVYAGDESLSAPIKIDYSTGNAGNGTLSSMIGNTIDEVEALFHFGASHFSSELMNRLFDQDNGLLFYAPVFALSIVGLIVFVQKNPLALARNDLLILCLPELLFLIMYSLTDSVGGFCPPARTVLPLLIPAIIFLAIGIGEIWRRGWVLIYAILTTLGLSMVAFLIANPHYIYAHGIPTLLSTPLIDLRVVFPVFAAGGLEFGGLVSVVFWVSTACLIGVWIVKGKSAVSPDKKSGESTGYQWLKRSRRH